VSDGALFGRTLQALAETINRPRDVVLGALALGRARLLFRDCKIGRRVRAFGGVRVVAEGRIALGDLVFFLGGIVPSELVCHSGAEILIGEGTGFGYGVSIEARRSVTVGKRCLFGAMVRLGDTVGGASAPIVLGDDVWIAHGAIVHPGVTIGSGSVVSAGSVVAGDVPPGRMAIGNPARPVPLEVRRGT
jgi:maltose O-acetyltransferase